MGRIGDILSPTPNSEIGCGLFAGGIFKPECWAAASGGYSTVTPNQLVNPSNAYPQPPALLPPTAPQTQAELTLPGAWTSGQAIAGGIAASQANASSFFKTYFPNGLTAPADASSSTALWIAAALAAAGLVFVFAKQ